MIHALTETIKEYWTNRDLMMKMALSKIEKTTIRATGGIFWIYFHDILYYAAFTFFRILLSGKWKGVGISGIEYLMTGLVPWLLFSEVLNGASQAIRNNKVIIQSIHFPIVILPGVEVVAVFIKKLPTFLFVLIACAYYGHLKDFNPLLFVYYLAASFLLMMAVTLLFSGINAVCEDFHQIFIAVMRVLFFALPIMWSFNTLEESGYYTLEFIVKLNPLIYLIQGFRDAFVYGPHQTLAHTAYFWTVTCMIFLLGCFVQEKLKKYYSDFI